MSHTLPDLAFGAWHTEGRVAMFGPYTVKVPSDAGPADVQ